MKKFIIANWKMNPATYSEAAKLLSAIAPYAQKNKAAEVVICPPFTWLAGLPRENIKGVAFGSQDVSANTRGAYTGQVSATMLKNLGARYAIIGHSERRASGDTDIEVGKKVSAALLAGLKVILCVGEPLDVRKQGFAAAKKFIKDQLKKNLSLVSAGGFAGGKLLIAYEPVWAISTSREHRDETPDDAGLMIKFIRELLSGGYHLKSPLVIYGGSVNAGNAGGFIRNPAIGGALVGAASLKALEFIKILKTSI